MPVRKVKFTEIPVIQISPLPPGIPSLSMLEQLPYEVVMLHVMLPLDAVAILNLCAASAVIQQICRDEYFWQQKTIQDFGAEERPLEGDTWKNVYFNNLNLSRKLKQSIQKGDIDSVRDITNALLETEPINLNDFIIAALNEGHLNIVWFLIHQMHRAPPISGGLDVLCLMANTPKSMKIFRKYFRMYSLIRHHPVFMLELFHDLMKCVIQSKKKTFIRYTYTRYLNRYGLVLGTEPQQFENYARSLGNTGVIPTIRETYNAYKRATERVETRVRRVG